MMGTNRLGASMQKLRNDLPDGSLVVGSPRSQDLVAGWLRRTGSSRRASGSLEEVVFGATSGTSCRETSCPDVGTGSRTVMLARAVLLACVVSAAPLGTVRADLDTEADPNDADVGAAQAETYPHFFAEARAELENNIVYHAEAAERGTKRNTLLGTVSAEVGVEFNENLAVVAEFTVEPVEDASEGDNEELNRQGIFAEQLFVEWKNERLELAAGKFNPTFGLSFEASNDLFGDEYPVDYKDFNEDVEITEQIGGRLAYDLGNDVIGSAVLSGELFAADTSNLTRSAIRSRGKLNRSDGGPSNTGNLDNFAINLIGEEIPALPGLTYHLGYSYLSSDKIEDDDADDMDILDVDFDDDEPGLPSSLTGRSQRGYVGDLIYGFPVNDNLKVKLLSEFIYLDNADGEANHSRTLLTLAGSLILRENLYLGFSYARRDDRVPLSDDSKSFLLQTSVGYFKDLRAGMGRLGFEVTSRRARDESLRKGTVGLRLIWRGAFE